jgi:hypothetical protein
LLLLLMLLLAPAHAIEADFLQACRLRKCSS